MVPGAGSNDGYLKVFAPFDNSLIAEVEAADNAVVEMALDTAYKLYKNRDAWLHPSRRIDILTMAAALMQDRAEELALEAAREGGKPLMDSKVEIARAIDSMKSCVETMRTEAGREIPMNLNAASTGKLAVTRYEPIGVVVALSAFNHPLNLIVHQVGPAIAAGCPVIVKPAETTPLSCLRLVEILREAGLPEAWCQALVVNDLSVAQKLVTDERVGFLTFIGSAKVGWMLKSKLAPGARCALEHGGAAPVIVDKEADVDAAIAPLAKGGFYHAGQVCVSVQRVYVHDSIAEEFSAKLALAAEKMIVGDPTLPTTEIGPLIRHGEVDRVEEWVQEAINSGAKLLCGGERLSDSCYKCTVLYDPPAEAKVSTMEIFGPVICVYPYSDIDEALERANALPFAFQAAVFSQNIDTAMYCYNRLDAAAVMINEHTAFRVDWMPFAGAKQSGYGIGGIKYTMRDMQVEKLLVLKSKGL
ncbi:MAG: aldehyde dehydrogenase family protein [Deferribacteres bacterium]|nr:aldehyde dehydrogenase family protein [candidate division KSB1 bacterium]MCB9500317.1 aldehyde dehydrogenase family protein [Deferribacteres bacterium]